MAIDTRHAAPPAGFGMALLAAGLAVLSGCSKAAAVETRCVADGEPRAVCSCLAKTTEKAVDPRMFEVIVLGAEGKTDEAQARYNALPPEMQVASSQAVRAAREQCKAKPPVAAPPKASSVPTASPTPAAPATGPT
jgi:hypothetical protein